jgi:hypothetical protein
MISILALFLQAAAAPVPAPAPWTVTPRPNADPTITSTVVGTPSTDGSATLRLRCDAGKEKIVSVQLFTKTALGGPPDRPVTLTIDANTPMGTNWEFVDKGAYVREDIAVTTITTAIAGGKVIKVHTTTATSEPIDASFAGPPSAEPVKAVLVACGYTLGTPPVRVDPKEKKKKK